MIIILFITIAVGTMFIELNTSLTGAVDSVMKNANGEVFSFYPNVTEQDIIDAQWDFQLAVENKVEQLAQTYDFQYENYRYSVLKENGHIIRAYSAGRTIDRPHLCAGRDTPVRGELLLDIGYADSRHVSVGDRLSLSSEEYTVVGLVVFPDKLSPIVDDSGIPYDRSTQALVMMNSGDFSDLEEDKCDEYVAIAGESCDYDELSDDLGFFSVIMSADNPQILSTVNSKISMNKIILSFALTIMFTIALLLLVMTIAGQIDIDASNLGVMKALGYKNSELARQYLVYFFIVLAPSVLGYAAGRLVLPYFTRLMTGDLTLPTGTDGINWVILLLLTVAPAALFALFGFVMALLKVSKPALNMIRSGGKKGANRIARAANKGIKPERYLKGVKKLC